MCLLRYYLSYYIWYKTVDKEICLLSRLLFYHIFERYYTFITSHTYLFNLLYQVKPDKYMKGNSYSSKKLLVTMVGDLGRRTANVYQPNNGIYLLLKRYTYPSFYFFLIVHSIILIPIRFEKQIIYNDYKYIAFPYIVCQINLGVCQVIYWC